MSVRAFRGELLSVGADPRDHADAVRHEADGLLVVEDGIVVARGAYAELAGQFEGVAVEALPGLIVPGFVDAHVHYPQMDKVAAYGEQLLDWLERHIFPAEKAFADRAHADAVADAFLTELLRNGTTSALVFPTVHEGSVDALFEAAQARNMRIAAGKVLMDLGPEGLRDTVETGRSESEALIQEGLNALRKGRTTFVIAHRLSTIISSDQILVLEHGEIVESGSHDKLLEANGRYRQLYDKQYRFERNRYVNPGEELTPV